MNDIERFKKFEDYFINFCRDFWASEIVELPFGQYVVFDPQDEPSMLFQGDVHNTLPQDIIDSIETISSRLNVEPSFRLSSSWQGDLKTFETKLKDNGYSAGEEIINFYMTDINPNPKAHSNSFYVEKTDDVDFLMRECFEVFYGQATELLARIRYVLETNEEAQYPKDFFVARTKLGEFAGIAGCSHKNDMGYMSSLYVLESHRNQGCATQLVSERLEFLKNKGVSHVFTSINSENKASIKAQEKIGYKQGLTSTIWTKTAEHNA